MELQMGEAGDDHLKFGPGHFNTVQRDELHREVAQQERAERYAFLLDVRDRNGVRRGEPGYDAGTLQIPTSALHRMTPFEKQYWRIKMDNYDVVVFFAKGKFYELYEEDADIGAQELGLKVANRVNMRMAGVPVSAFATYAAKLLERGYKIGCVNEMETSDEMRARVKGKGSKEQVVDRQLVRIYTASTATDPDLAVSEGDMYCLALGFDGTEIGVCYGDASVGRFFVGAVPDSALHGALHTVLHRVHPVEVVLPRDADPEVVAVARNLGFAQVVLADAPQDPAADVTAAFRERGRVPAAVDARLGQAAVVAAVALLRQYYASLRIPDATFGRGTFGAYAEAAAGALVLDAQSIVNLDLYSGRRRSREGTLLHFVDHCATPFGRRMLRERFLLRPLTDAGEIARRQRLVAFLIENAALVENVRTFLRPLPDLERILAQCVAGAVGEANFVRLVAGLETCQKLVNELEAVAAETPDVLRELVTNAGDAGFPPLAGFLERMERAYDFERAAADHTVVFLAGYCAEIDAAKERRAQLDARFAEELRKARGVFGSAAVAYIALNGEEHVIDVPARAFAAYLSRAGALPAGYTDVNATKTSHRVQSAVVADLQLQADLLDQQIADSHRILFARLVADAAAEPGLARAVASVGLLDCYISLALCSAAMPDACFPTFDAAAPAPFFDADGLRHPYLAVATTAIPSDVRLGGPAPSTLILTGPNMGGKSTLLRTVCLAVVMAQMGMRVMARRLALTPVDRIFTRIGASDDILHGRSTFMVELEETAQVLHAATRRSLVVLDELGRGTSTHDGLAIAHAVVKFLAERVRPLAVVSTHYHQLCGEFDASGAVRLAHMGCEVDAGRVVFLYALRPGPCPKSYGMSVAAMAGMDPRVVRRAETMAAWFELYSWWRNAPAARLFVETVSARPHHTAPPPATRLVDP